jgi:hypothetical protein
MGSFIKPGGVLVFGVPFVVEGFVLRQVSTYSAFLSMAPTVFLGFSQKESYLTKIVLGWLGAKAYWDG